MEKIDEAIVSLQQVKGKTKNPMKACNALTFIPGFTFIPDCNLNIFVNEEKNVLGRDKAPVTDMKCKELKWLESLSFL